MLDLLDQTRSSTGRLVGHDHMRSRSSTASGRSSISSGSPTRPRTNRPPPGLRIATPREAAAATTPNTRPVSMGGRAMDAARLRACWSHRRSRWTIDERRAGRCSRPYGLGALGRRLQPVSDAVRARRQPATAATSRGHLLIPSCRSRAAARMSSRTDFALALKVGQPFNGT